MTKSPLKNISKYKISILFGFYLLLGFSFSAYCNATSVTPDEQINAVRDLIDRLLPNYADRFLVEIIDKNSQGFDVFEVESVSENKIMLRGSTGVSIASGLNWYLKEKCFCQISWLGDNLRLPSRLPAVQPKVVKNTPYRYFYYYNVCTFGYTTVFWNWKQWEREMDWMALNGINMPLAFVGQEIVWTRVYEQLGLTFSDLQEFFTGPAFLPWHTMGNIDSWGGPLPYSWLSISYILQTRILQRQREFGMTPVLPAFAGHVPQALKKQFPKANITQLAPWIEWNGTYFLDPLDPLFQKVASLFIAYQQNLYGSDHLYNADPYNELRPPSNETNYLASVSRAVFSGMNQADPLAVWILQGWFLVNDAQFWQPPQMKAFLDAVPSDNLIVLDLWAEASPAWKKTEGFYGKSFVWCMLHNFGGRPGLYGMLPSVNQGPIEAMKTYGNQVVGIGLTPEAIDTNPIMYDLVSEMNWRDSSVDLNHWVSDYAHRRYGQALNCSQKTWQYLQNSVYNCSIVQEGATGSVIGARPSLSIVRTGCCAPTKPFYRSADVFQAWEALLDCSDALQALETYRNDLVLVGTQVLSDISYNLHLEIVHTFNVTKNQSRFLELTRDFSELIIDLNTLLQTQKDFLLGPWISNARSMGITSEEADLYEWNARTQITLWGTKKSFLSGYAYKLWAGLVKDFYGARWLLFFQKLWDSLQNGQPFNQEGFNEQVENLEEQWTLQHNPYSLIPTGDTVLISKALLSKYEKLCH